MGDRADAGKGKEGKARGMGYGVQVRGGEGREGKGRGMGYR